MTSSIPKSGEENSAYKVIREAKEMTVNEIFNTYGTKLDEKITKLNEMISIETNTDIKIKLLADLRSNQSKNKKIHRLKKIGYDLFTRDIKNMNFGFPLITTLKMKLTEYIKKLLLHKNIFRDQFIVLKIVDINEVVTECIINLKIMETNAPVKVIDPDSVEREYWPTIEKIIEYYNKFTLAAKAGNINEVQRLNATLVNLRQDLMFLQESEKSFENNSEEMMDGQSEQSEQTEAFILGLDEDVTDFIEICLDSISTYLIQKLDRKEMYEDSASVSSESLRKKLADNKIKLIKSNLFQLTNRNGNSFFALQKFVEYYEKKYRDIITTFVEMSYRLVRKSLEDEINKLVEKFPGVNSKIKIALALKIVTLNHVVFICILNLRVIEKHEKLRPFKPRLDYTNEPVEPVAIAREIELKYRDVKTASVNAERYFNKLMFLDSELMGYRLRLNQSQKITGPPILLPAIVPQVEKLVLSLFTTQSQTDSQSKSKQLREDFNKRLRHNSGSEFGLSLSSMFGTGGKSEEPPTFPDLANSIMSGKFTNCVNRDCLLSHKLGEIDRDNFGKLYVGNQTATNIFPHICQHCLLAKFGLYESFVELGTIDCIVKKSPKVGDKLAGPFLKASSIKNIENNKKKVVFPNNAVVLPSGQSLMEILMSNPHDLYDVNKNVPTILNATNEYSLNAFIYGYFKRIHDVVSDQTSSRVNESQLKTMEDVLQCENIANLNQYLKASAEVDAMLMSQLIQPSGSLSKYVVNGESSILDNKQIKVVILPKLLSSPERADDKSASVTLGIWNSSKNIYSIGRKEIQLLNQFLSGHVFSTRQLIVNRKLGLQKLFEDSHGDSAIQLHVSSFCFPKQIMNTNECKKVKYNPNCSFIPGIGLVSTADICEGDVLIIDRNVYLDHFVRLKMSNYEDYTIYNEDNKRRQISAKFVEIRKTFFNKSCLY